MTQPEEDPNVDPQETPEPVADESLGPIEDAFYALVLASLAAWLAAVSVKILNPFRKFNLPPAPQELWSMGPDWSKRVDTMITWLKEHAVPHGWTRWRKENRALADRADLPDLPSTDAFIAAQLGLVRNYLVRIPEEVFNQIMAEVVEGHNDGESFEQIAERIESTLSMTGSENWPNRARVIAVTETNGAANAGWMAAAAEAQKELGIRLYKDWLQAHDNRVRPEHQPGPGLTRRPLLDPFIVGGVPMMYPGIKTAPPHLVINCRCAAATTEQP